VELNVVQLGTIVKEGGTECCATWNYSGRGWNWMLCNFEL